MLLVRNAFRRTPFASDTQWFRHLHGGENYGPVGENYGPGVENYGQVGGNYGPGGENYGPGVENYGPVGENYGPLGENYGQVGGNYGPGVENYGQVGGNYGPGGENYGPGVENYGQVGGNYGPGVENYGQVGENYGQVGENYGPGGENDGQGGENYGPGGESYTPVREFYKNKSVLVTGATGFTGQALVEKLLRSCPEIGKIYIPIRSKNCLEGRHRYEKFLNKTVFDRLRTINPNFGDKVVPFLGQLETPSLGLSDDMFDKLTDEVSIIFHLAALIKFNPPLSEALRANVLLSTNVIRFGQQCKHLQAYVLTSSIFTHIDLDFVEEKVYPSDWNHDHLIDLMNQGDLKRHERAIVGTSTGTYFATKKVAESLTKAEGRSLPVAIVRPGKISPALKEPVPGWSYGLGSYIIWMKQVEQGSLEANMGRQDKVAEVIPVDLVVNNLIATAWYLGTGQHGLQHTGEPLVVNADANAENSITLQEFANCVNRYMADEGRSTRVKFFESRLWIFLRYGIPGLFYSVPIILRGEIPINLILIRIGLIKSVHQLNVKENPKEYANMDAIDAALSHSDRKVFSANFNRVDWDAYIRTWLRTIKEKREARQATRLPGN